MNGRRLTAGHTPDEDTHLLFWIAVFAAAALILIRFGYDFGGSDQDEFLPLLAHLMDPDVLRNDWLVGIQSSSFNVRTAFVVLLAALAGLIGAPESVHVLYALSFVGVCLGIFRIAFGLHGHSMLAALAVVGSVAVTARWNPGGNDVIHTVLVPSMLAWAISLNALAYLWIGRISMMRCGAAAVLVASAVLFQPLVGLQTASIAFVVLLLDNEKRFGHIALFGGLTLVLAVPVVVPLALDSGLLGSLSADQAAVDGAVGLSGAEILARIRAPHHYLPEAFGPGRWLRLWILVAAGAFVLWRMPARLSGRVRRRLLTASVAILLVLGVSRIVIALDPFGPVTMVQPFKLTVLLRIIAVTAAAGLFTAITNWPRISLTALSVPSVAVLVGLYTGLIGADRAFPFINRSADPVGDVHSWIHSETQEHAVIAVPPSHTGFSWATRRAQYVNFKAVPFEESNLRQWLARIETVAPVDHSGLGGSALLDDLDRAFHARRPAEWRAVMVGESIDYLLVYRGEHFWYPPDAADYCNRDWCVYSERELRSIDEWRYATD